MTVYGWFAIAILAALVAVNTWYYVEKVWDLNRRHQRHVDALRHEYRIQDQMLRGLTLPTMVHREEGHE